MAFYFERTYPDGIAVNHWEITSITNDPDLTTTSVVLSPYVSQTIYRNNHDNYIGFYQESFEVPRPDNFQTLTMDEYKTYCYSQIKLTPTWTSAVDV